jgi:hypothetical protein
MSSSGDSGEKSTNEWQIDAGTAGRLRSSLADVERRGRQITSRRLRHDINNAVGAARNALVLFDEDARPEAAARFMQIALRNVARAEALLNEAAAEESASSPSARNERNDLGGAREGENGNSVEL